MPRVAKELALSFFFGCGLFGAAHWCGLLAVKLAPGAYATRAGETKREETKKDR